MDTEVDKNAIPDAMLHYPPIYYLHVALMLATAIWAITVTAISFSPVNILCSACVVILAAVFSLESLKHRPSIISSLIERNRVIWRHVFEHMRENGAKPLVIDK